MGKRNKNKFHVLFLVGLLCLLFVPQHTTYAFFQDSETVPAGISLELGNVDLDFSDSNQDGEEIIVIPTNNTKVEITAPSIKNNGSLDGNIFYKIDLYQTTDQGKTPVPNDIINHNGNKFELYIQTKEKEQKITSNKVGFMPICDERNNALVLSPTEITNLGFKFSSNNMGDVNSYIIQFTFLMTQTNGTLSNPMFHEELILSYEIKLNKNVNSSSAATFFGTNNYRTILDKNRMPLSETSIADQGEESDKNNSVPAETKDTGEEVQNNNEESSLAEEVSSDKEKVQEQTEEQEKVETVTPPEQPEEQSEQIEQPESNNFPIDEEFKYVDIKLNEETYNIGITQNQFNELLQFGTVEEFGSQVTEETPALYVKYDKVTGIEDMEQFVFDLAEQKQINFEIFLEDHTEEKLLEITFTK